MHVYNIIMRRLETGGGNAQRRGLEQNDFAFCCCRSPMSFDVSMGIF
jgi:hypothetical protein